MSDRERVAKKLHELFGTALYGHDIGPWESDRVQDERSRWLAHADALLASDALAQMLAEARAEALRKLADDIDVTGYGWTDVLHAQRFVGRLRARAALAKEGGDRVANPDSHEWLGMDR